MSSSVTEKRQGKQPKPETGANAVTQCANTHTSTHTQTTQMLFLVACSFYTYKCNIHSVHTHCHERSAHCKMCSERTHPQTYEYLLAVALHHNMKDQNPPAAEASRAAFALSRVNYNVAFLSERASKTVGERERERDSHTQTLIGQRTLKC